MHYSRLRCGPRRRVCVALLLLAGCGGGGEQEKGGEGTRPTVVAVAPVRAEPVTRVIEGVGDLLAAEAVVLTAESAGRVAAVLFTEGQRVSRGQVLVRFEAEEEQAQVAVATADTSELRGQLARQEVLAREGAIARGPVEDLRRQIQAAEARGRAAQAVAAERVVRAPFAGTVGLRDLSPGALVTPGAEIATLDNIDTLRVRFTLPERDIGRVQVGNTVQVTSPAFPGRVFTGRVSSFDSRLDPQQRTLQVEARLPNPDRSLRPGMLANVRIGAERNERALVVPAVAVQLRGAEHFVFRMEGRCAARVTVRVGQREPGRVEILTGLRANDQVIVEGLQQLNGGEAVVLKGQGPPRSAQRGEKKDDGQGEAKKKAEGPPCPAERRAAEAGSPKG